MKIYNYYYNMSTLTNWLVWARRFWSWLLRIGVKTILWFWDSRLHGINRQHWGNRCALLWFTISRILKNLYAI